ncbi:SH3 domain-binding glutamic acid-rich protein-like isoform X1 [Dinothrombium tinctorium]|uniref:SH3 domain-binding glutamic acid-rich protein-like isoform X1 n=1 Tax=Dinothrombium tinctorium TaxID=1965070 RepID=A0A3S3P4V7_9ACAR|nr:SH3 domain-binding glutamic acid-rich protein-like isoform X1 [Dinothrombium tinctorium]
MVIKVYISGISANKEVKGRQQRALLLLDTLRVDYEKIDITEPGHEQDKEMLKEVCTKRNDSIPLPPQFFNEDDYCGDWFDFETASDEDRVLSFLKLKPESTKTNDVEKRLNADSKGEPQVDGEIDSSNESNATKTLNDLDAEKKGNGEENDKNAVKVESKTENDVSIVEEKKGEEQTKVENDANKEKEKEAEDEKKDDDSIIKNINDEQTIKSEDADNVKKTEVEKEVENSDKDDSLVKDKQSEENLNDKKKDENVEENGTVTNANKEEKVEKSELKEEESSKEAESDIGSIENETEQVSAVSDENVKEATNVSPGNDEKIEGSEEKVLQKDLEESSKEVTVQEVHEAVSSEKGDKDEVIVDKKVEADNETNEEKNKETGEE